MKLLPLQDYDIRAPFREAASKMVATGREPVKLAASWISTLKDAVRMTSSSNESSQEQVELQQFTYASWQLQHKVVPVILNAPGDCDATLGLGLVHIQIQDLQISRRKWICSPLTLRTALVMRVSNPEAYNYASLCWMPWGITLFLSLQLAILTCIWQA